MRGRRKAPEAWSTPVSLRRKRQQQRRRVLPLLLRHALAYPFLQTEVTVIHYITEFYSTKAANRSRAHQVICSHFPALSLYNRPSPSALTAAYASVVHSQPNQRQRG